MTMDCSAQTAEPQKVYYIQSTVDSDTGATIARYLRESTSTGSYAFDIEPISIDDYSSTSNAIFPFDMVSYEEIDKWYSDQEAAYSRKAAHELAEKYSFTVKESAVNMVRFNRKCFMRLKTFNNLRF